MKNSAWICILVSLVLSGCNQVKTPVIEGMDLTKIQKLDYFQDNRDGAKKLAEWCKVNVNPADTSSDEATIRNLTNCRNANSALVLPPKDWRKNRVYQPE